MTLTLWDRDILKEDWAKQIIEEYQAANPHVTIEYVLQPSDISQADQAFKAAGIAEDGPDIATLYAGGMVNSFADFLEPMDGRLLGGRDRAAQRLGHRPPGLRRRTASCSRCRSAPASTSTSSATSPTCRRPASRRSTPPQTWEEFLDVMQQVKDGGQLPVMMGNQEGYAGAWIMGALVGGQIGTAGFFSMLAGDTPINDP